MRRINIGRMVRTVATVAVATMLAPSAPAAPPPKAALAAAFPTDPGLHDDILIPGSDMSADVYLPKTYGKDKAVRHPVVFSVDVVGPTKDHYAELKLTDWADAMGVVLVNVNQRLQAPGPVGAAAVPGRPAPKGVEALATYTALVDAVPQLHPALRVAYVPSSGTVSGQMAAAVAKDHSKSFCGVVFGPGLWVPTPGSMFNAPDAKIVIPASVGVALLRVTPDAYARGRPEELLTFEVIRAGSEFDLWDAHVAPRLKAAGNPYLTLETIDWHTHGDDLRTALAWLTDAAVLKRPTAVTEAEKAAWRKGLNDRLAKAAQIADPQERERTLRAHLSLPGLNGPEAVAAAKAWRESIAPAGEARAQLVMRHDFWTQMLRNPQLAGTPEARTVAAKLEALKATAEWKKELKARERVNALKAAASTHNGRLDAAKVAALTKLQAEFDKVAAENPTTYVGREATVWSKNIHYRLLDFR